MAAKERSFRDIFRDRNTVGSQVEKRIRWMRRAGVYKSARNKYASIDKYLGRELFMREISSEIIRRCVTGRD